MIEFRKVSFGFAGSSLLLENWDYQVGKGEFVAVLGPSGCGKSTLLRLAMGALMPTSGQVFCEESNKGVVFQEPNLIPWKTCIENIQLAARLRKRDFGVELIEDLLAKLALQKAKNKYPRELSGGMKMRAALARALLTQPKVLFLDEPFSSLDELSRLRLQDDLRRLFLLTTMTVIMVTHSISESVFLADRIVVVGGKPLKVYYDNRSLLSKERPSVLRYEPAFLEEMKRVRSALLQAGDSDL